MRIVKYVIWDLQTCIPANVLIAVVLLGLCFLFIIIVELIGLSIARIRTGVNIPTPISTLVFNCIASGCGSVSGRIGTSLCSTVDIGIPFLRVLFSSSFILCRRFCCPLTLDILRGSIVCVCSGWLRRRVVCVTVGRSIVSEARRVGSGVVGAGVFGVGFILALL